MRRWLLRCVWLLVGALCLAEIALRVVAAFPADSACFVTRPDGYRYRPGTTGCGPGPINDRGFADAPHADAKPAGVIRVAIVGDSMVSGSSARVNNVSNLLRARIAASGKPMEIVNLGLDGAGPYEYLDVMRTDAASLHADVVVVVFFVGTDVTQANPDFRTRIWLGRPHETLRRPYLLGASLEYSYAFRMLRNLARSLDDWRHQESNATFAPETFRSIEYQRIDIYARQPSPFVRQSYAALPGLVDAIAGEVRQQRATLIGVIVPDEIAIDASVRAEVLSSDSERGARYDFTAPDRALGDALTRAGAEVVSLAPLFQAMPAATDVYLPRNTHLNAIGNGIMADAIWEAIARHAGHD